MSPVVVASGSGPVSGEGTPVGGALCVSATGIFAVDEEDPTGTCGVCIDVAVGRAGVSSGACWGAGRDGMGSVSVVGGGTDADRYTCSRGWGSGVGVRPLNLSHFARILRIVVFQQGYGPVKRT